MNRIYKAYELQNEDMVDWVSYLSDQDLSKIQYLMNDERKAVKIFASMKEFDYCTSSVTHHFEQKYSGQTVSNVTNYN